MHDADATVAPTLAPVTLAVAPLLLGAAAASIGAGLVHAAAAGTHAGAPDLVRLFAATAALQVLWALVAMVRPNRAVLAAGVVLNAGAVIAWALSRTRGLPWPSGLEGIEDAGTQDVIATALGASAALAAGLALARPWLAKARRGRPPTVALIACSAALALAVPGMASAHAHGDSHDHGHEGDSAAVAGGADGPALAAGGGDDHHGGGDGTGDHGHDDGAAAEPALAAGPIIDVDDPRVSAEQREAAVALIDSSTTAMSRYADTASVEAAGYFSIGDSVTGFEHFVHPGYLTDGVDLDPERVESIVFVVNPDGTKALGSAMFILTPGQTMDDVPEIAGELTTWHDHQNLCWEGLRVVGTLDASGACPRGEFRPTPPMLHVWMVPHPCGPFAGLEGHGGDCSHGH